MNTQKEIIDDFAALIGALPGVEYAERSLDLSAMWGKPEGTVLFTYKALTAKEFFRIPEMSEKIGTQKPEWSDVHRQTVAAMILAHITPAITPDRIMFRYVELVDKIALPDFVDWVRRFNELFPELMQQSKAVSEEKETEGQ